MSKGLILRKSKPPVTAESPFMTLAEAAAFLNLNKDSLRLGRCGTQDLVRVYQGQLIYFERAAIVGHAQSMLDHAKEQQRKRKGGNHVWPE